MLLALQKITLELSTAVQQYMGAQYSSTAVHGSSVQQQHCQHVSLIAAVLQVCPKYWNQNDNWPSKGGQVLLVDTHNNAQWQLSSGDATKQV